MGVKTIFFGPCGWTSFEGLAVSLDRALAFFRENKNEENLIKVQNAGRNLFLLLGYALPCVYCRVSYLKFTSSKNQNKYCDINRSVTSRSAHSAKRFVYAIHEEVNLKLSKQDIAAAGKDPVLQSQVMEKWQHYQPSFEQTIKQRFPDASTLTFWHAFTQFLGFVMCDYREEEACFIHKFFMVCGQILSMDPVLAAKQNGILFLKALAQDAASWTADMNQLEHRVSIVYNIRAFIMNQNGWEEQIDFDTFYSICRSSIVGCEKNHKKNNLIQTFVN